MPEFQMPYGTSYNPFRKLDSFTQAYVEAMFFTECHGDNPELEDCTFDDLATETLQRITEDCADFQHSNADLLADIDSSQAGHDFWLTRNRHGAGFWDRGLGETGQILTDTANACGETYLYVGDDQKLYLG